MTRRLIAVVGAGIAGLHAARRLHQAGHDVVVMEARERLGGRILTTADGFDLGPSWYWPHVQPALDALVRELGLPTFPQAIDGDVIFERMSRETPRRYRPVTHEQQSMRLAGGTAALIDALAHELPADRIQLGSHVTAASLTEDGVELSMTRSGGTGTVMAAHVIAALPPRLLAAIALSPSPDVERWRTTPTWMAPHAKFFALYDRPFWRDAGLSGTAQSMVGPMLEMHDATTAAGQPALFGFVGVGADQRAALGEEALARACITQLARIFGPDARSPRATHFKDWAADPHTATVADRTPGGAITPSDAPWVTGPWLSRLELAGTETSPAEAGFLAGAVLAADRAVAATLAKL